MNLIRTPLIFQTLRNTLTITTSASTSALKLTHHVCSYDFTHKYSLTFQQRRFISHRKLVETEMIDPRLMQSQKEEPSTKINNRITARVVFLVDEEGKVLSEAMPLREALDLAKSKKLDLIQVAENKTPRGLQTVVKIASWYKFNKKQKDAVKNSAKVPKMKEISINTSIAQNDREIKLAAIRRFLEGGMKVSVTIIFGTLREADPLAGTEHLENLFKEIDDVGRKEGEILRTKMGRGYSQVFMPLPHIKTKLTEDKRQKRKEELQKKQEEKAGKYVKNAQQQPATATSPSQKEVASDSKPKTQPENVIRRPKLENENVKSASKIVDPFNSTEENKQLEQEEDWEYQLGQINEEESDGSSEEELEQLDQLKEEEQQSKEIEPTENNKKEKETQKTKEREMQTLRKEEEKKEEVGEYIDLIKMSGTFENKLAYLEKQRQTIGAITPAGFFDEILKKRSEQKSRLAEIDLLEKRLRDEQEKIEQEEKDNRKWLKEEVFPEIDEFSIGANNENSSEKKI